MRHSLQGPSGPQRTQMAPTLLFDMLALLRSLTNSQSCPEQQITSSRWSDGALNPLCIKSQFAKLEMPFPPCLLKQPGRSEDGIYSRALS